MISLELELPGGHLVLLHLSFPLVSSLLLPSATLPSTVLEGAKNDEVVMD